MGILTTVPGLYQPSPTNAESYIPEFTQQIVSKEGKDIVCPKATVHAHLFPSFYLGKLPQFYAEKLHAYTTWWKDTAVRDASPCTGTCYLPPYLNASIAAQFTKAIEELQKLFPPANRASVIQVIPFEERLSLTLEKWCEQPTFFKGKKIGEVEKTGRQIASERILEAYESRSESLSLRGLGLYSLSDDVCKLLSSLSHLRMIDISENPLQKIPDPFTKLSTSSTLIAEVSPLTFEAILISALEKWYEEPPFSKEEKKARAEKQGRAIACERILEAYESQDTALSLRGLDLSYLPDIIGQLNHLRVIDISENPLQEIPDAFAELPATTVVIALRSGLSESAQRSFCDMVDEEKETDPMNGPIPIFTRSELSKIRTIS